MALMVFMVFIIFLLKINRLNFLIARGFDVVFMVCMVQMVLISIKK